MRVLMLAWEYPPRVAGGLGVACAGLVRGLRENGVDVLLLLPPAGRAALRRERRRGARRRAGVGALEIVHAPGARRLARVDPYAGGEAPAVRGPRGGALYAGDVADAVQRFASAAYALARRRRFDVVHAHDWMTFPAGVAAKQASGRPLIAHVHATERDRAGGAAFDSPASRIERRSLPLADRVVTVSRYTAEILREHYGVTADRIRVVHNATDAPDAPRRRRRRGPPLVLFAGRVTGQKGPEQFVRAAALVASERRDVRFVLAGAGDRLDSVRAEADVLGLSGRIRFPGFVPRAALDRLYARADVFVMPSRSEPFGLAALEAISRGAGAIVPRSSGVAEVVRHALRADFGDVEGLAALILWLLELPGLHERTVAFALDDARRLSWRGAAARCAAIYTELVALDSAAPGGDRIAPA
jgi:glycogen(starch) synthase